MALPKPEPGLVIRYSYLWDREAKRGEVAGRKDRPCAIVIAVEHAEFGTITYVAPITHSPPTDAGDAVELPTSVKRRLALDDLPSWIVTTEFNAFVWPGFDLAVIDPGVAERDFVYGALPEAIIEQVLASFRNNLKRSRATIVKRPE